MLPDHDLDDLLGGLVDKIKMHGSRIDELEKKEDWGICFNVRNYGAKGDGVTDDTAAIQATISALPAGGGKIFFPTGTYKQISTINWPNKNVVIEGDGEGSVINYTAVDGTDCWYFNNFVPTYNRKVIRDLCFIGAGAGAATGDGLHFYFCTNITVMNVDARRFGGGAGIHFQGSQICNIYGGDYRLNKYGIHLGNYATDIYGYGYDLQTAIIGIYNCQTQENNYVGIYVHGDSVHGYVPNIGIRDSVIQGERRDGILIEYSYQIVVDDVYYESNNSTAIPGCADIRTVGTTYALTFNNLWGAATPIFCALDGNCSGTKFLNCVYDGALNIAATCLNIVLENSMSATVVDLAANTITQNFQHLRTSDAWTPGFVAAGGKVSAIVDFVVDLATSAVANAKITTGWTPGTILYAYPGYDTSHSVRVTLINLTGGDVTYPATTLYVDCWSQKSPY